MSLPENDVGALQPSASTQKKEVKKWDKMKHFRGVGIVAVLLSCAFYAANALLVKLIRDSHSVQISLSRFSVQFLILLPILTFKRKEVDILGKPGLKKFMWIRGICGGIGLTCFYTAITFLPVADAVTLSYSRMMMVPFMARLFLKERIAVLEICLGFVSLVGVVLIAQPSFLFPGQGQKDDSNLLGVLFGLIGAALQGISMITIRKLGKTYPPLSVGYYSICGAVIATVLLLILGEMRYPCYEDLPMVFLLGICGVLGQFFLTIGLQNERAGTVAVMSSLQLILINILQVVVLNVIPSILSIAGTALILCSSIVLGVRKGMRKPKSSESNGK